MKKFLFLFVGVLVCTGCSQKSLKCYIDSKIDDNTSTHKEYSIVFKNDIVSNFDMSIDVTLTDVDDVTSDNLKASVNDVFKEYSNMKGVNYSYNDKDNGFIISTKFDFNKIEKNDKDKVSILNYKKSYDAIKLDLENDGFTCK